MIFSYFFFYDSATTEIYTYLHTLSLHDALPIVLGYLITFRTEALGTSSGRKPNNSFKPNLLRYTKAMAEKACHGFGATTQVGLTQAICPFQHEIIRF